MYFPFFILHDWGKSSAEARSSHCAVLPYNHMTVADAIYAQEDGTFLVFFTIYIARTEGKYFNPTSEIQDESVFWLASKDAKADTDLEYYTSGTAVVRPYQDRDAATYQLISYVLDWNSKPDEENNINQAVDSSESESICERSKLKYPISEDDCYIIYKNYFGYEMQADESFQIDVDRLGKGDNEVLYFTIYHLNEITDGYTWADAFSVYVNTGVCERELMGEVFQADDYYY